MSRNDDDLLTVAEAAELLRVRPRTVTRYRQQGKLPYHRYSVKKVLYRRSDLIRFLDNSYNPPSFFDL